MILLLASGILENACVNYLYSEYLLETMMVYK